VKVVLYFVVELTGSRNGLGFEQSARRCHKHAVVTFPMPILLYWLVTVALDIGNYK